MQFIKSEMLKESDNAKSEITKNLENDKNPEKTEEPTENIDV